MSGFRYLAAVAALFILAFEGLRLALLIHFLPLTGPVPPGVLAQSFLVGLRYDLAVTGYILAPAALVGFLPVIGWRESRLARNLTTIYFTFAGGLAFFMTFADFQFFAQFNTRLNHMLLGWSDTPSISLHMAWESGPVLQYLIVFTLLLGAFAYALHFISQKSFRRINGESSSQRFAVYILTLVLLLIAMRGGSVGARPLTWSDSYFSAYHFANQLALNSGYTFVLDTILDRHDREHSGEIDSALPPEKAYSEVRDLLPVDPGTRLEDHPVARIENSGPEKRLNVIVILVESLAANFVGRTGGALDLTPELDRYSRDGLLFRNFYSSGSHTYTGIFSTVTGMPSLPGKALMKRDDGQQRFAGLAMVLKRRGYSTRFYLPHDPRFDNMNNFLSENGYDQVIGQFDYPQDEVVSALGVPDEVMYRHALKDLADLPRPFCVTLLSGSSHPPFIIPDRPHPHVPENSQNAKRINSTYYADWALARFYEGIRNADYGDSTVVVILGDHGVIWKPTHEVDLTLFHIPLLVSAPGWVKPGVSDRFGGQKDVTATVMDVLGGPWTNVTLGESLLRPDSGYALFIEGEMYGFLQGDRYLIHRGDGRFALFNFPGLYTLTGENSTVESLRDHAQALLSATQDLVVSHQVGLPDQSRIAE